MVKTFTGRIADAQKTHLFGVALGLKQTFPRYPMVRWLKRQQASCLPNPEYLE